jgi:hypothetical protein
MVREKVGLGGAGTLPKSGGVIVIVVGGNKGHGFSCQADLETTLALPEILENMVRQIRESGKL